LLRGGERERIKRISSTARSNQRNLGLYSRHVFDTLKGNNTSCLVCTLLYIFLAEKKNCFIFLEIMINGVKISHTLLLKSNAKIK
jgi:hypothetical protein